MRVLCREDDVREGGSVAFPAAGAGAVGLFAVRANGSLHVYVNACPHLGVPLDWLPGRFLSADGSRIICSMHGAEFRIEDGFCLAGPCKGEWLEPMPSIVTEQGEIAVMETAGGTE